MKNWLKTLNLNFPSPVSGKCSRARRKVLREDNSQLKRDERQQLWLITPRWLLELDASSARQQLRDPLSLNPKVRLVVVHCSGHDFLGNAEKTGLKDEGKGVGGNGQWQVPNICQLACLKQLNTTRKVLLAAERQSLIGICQLDADKCWDTSSKGIGKFSAAGVHRNLNEKTSTASPSEITWNRFVTSHSSSSPSVLRMTFIPEANCNFSSSFTRVFTAARVNGFFVVSQQAMELMLFKPKNKYPFESMAQAADCEPLGPRILKAFAYEFSSASHAVRLCSALSGTEFSCSEASEWKYSARFSPRLLFSTATPNIPSINSNDSPDIECVPKVGYGYINSRYREAKKGGLMYFQFTLAVRAPQGRCLNFLCHLHAVCDWLQFLLKLSTPTLVCGTCFWHQIHTILDSPRAIGPWIVNKHPEARHIGNVSFTFCTAARWEWVSHVDDLAKRNKQMCQDGSSLNCTMQSSDAGLPEWQRTRTGCTAFLEHRSDERVGRSLD